MPPVRRQISRYAAPLRRNMTDAERTLWWELRGRRFLGRKFRRQWTIGSYVVDFCCVEQRLIVEVDGGQHDEARDRARTDYLIGQGYSVVRFWNNEVLENLEGGLRQLASYVSDEKKEDPHPNPLPHAGEGE